MSTSKNISVVIPLFNEEESLPELHAWIQKVMNENQYSYEVVFVDDGSSDQSWKVIEELQAKDSNVVGIKFQRNYGKSAALHMGFQKVVGDVVITMDADLQDSPDEIPGLYKMITDEGYDLISGWKKKRYDPITKTIPTKLFNWATRKLSGIYLHDFNCGLKAYKKSVVKSVEVYGEMHRYIPVLAKFAGFKKIGEKVVQHQARKYGKTKFGMNRFMNGFLDLITVTFMGRFGKKPMHFFGAMGTLMFFLGFLLAIYLGIMKLFVDTEGKLIAQRTEFYLALTFMIIGSQMFLTGFIAELVNRNSSSRNNYLVEKEV
ncbi:MAG: glycosyltransferase family 2 protein [Crocinitomicaceae bacterium]|nr:glycosyltransferase family 2 protein [Crocinitomicaceae bacterium]